ncbi:MAG TPA: acetyl-CoA carboxylase biotin carboxyl carrier protein [Thermoanaerobaculia bacterium]|nr:acetyl-CoA carboxylase biotin carboxyl carrier protein [Thermoanaerobaculia bacterium]
MTFEQIKELIELVAQRRLQGLEIERSGFRLKVEGQPQAQAAVQTAAPAESASAPPPPPPSMPADSTSLAAASTPAAAPAADAGAHIVTSPIVGTFYRAASPDSDPFVEVGSRVKKGQVLCIIEAMKLMNEIESDADGVVAQIYPQNAQAVEYGEPLFAIRAD